RRAEPRGETLADCGVMNLPGGDRVRLHAAPEASRLDGLWQALAGKALGVVLFIDGAAADPVAELRRELAQVGPFVERGALVVGLSHTGSEGERLLRPALADALQREGLAPIVLSVDARVRADLLTLVKSALYSLDPRADLA
ncbi:MAG: hypothetical protein KGI35_05770, partial [Burkholderiales bacterium]|nr:hypothetical protein [Burkholderiales bacterium]